MYGQMKQARIDEFNDGNLTLIRIRSMRVVNAIDYLYRRGNATARDLAEVMKTEPKQVYPFLKTLITKSVVTVKKFQNINVYSLSPKFMSMIKSVVGKRNGQKEYVMSKALERYKQFTGKEADEVVKAIIEYFVEKALTGNPYLTATDESIAEILARALKLPIDAVREALKELLNANILFVWNMRKARLESSLLN